MTRFEMITSLTDVQKFSEVIFDILRDNESPEDIRAFLSEKLDDNAVSALRKLSERGYPLSLDGKQ